MGARINHFFGDADKRRFSGFQEYYIKKRFNNSIYKILLIILKSLYRHTSAPICVQNIFCSELFIPLDRHSAKTGIQDKNKIWIPASAGMTTFLIALFHIFSNAIN